MRRSYGAYARKSVFAVTQRSQFGAKFICDEFLTLLMARLSNADICIFGNDYVDKSISDKHILIANRIVHFYAAKMNHIFVTNTRWRYQNDLCHSWDVEVPVQP